MGISRSAAQKAKGLAAIRALRKVYRTSSSAGEKFERSLDRLLKRKRTIYPDEMTSTNQMLKDFQTKAKAVDLAMAQALTILMY